jgi:4-hydroxy-L-threonine phosphate dehydrogenase PdxA
MTQTHKPRIGITIGDLNGVGPEVVMKALADNRLHNIVTPVIYRLSKSYFLLQKTSAILKSSIILKSVTRDKLHPRV